MQNNEIRDLSYKVFDKTFNESWKIKFKNQINQNVSLLTT